MARKAPRGCRWKRRKARGEQPQRHRYCHACRRQRPFLGAKVIPSRNNEASGSMICGECWEQLQGDREMFLAYLSGFERLLARARELRPTHREEG